MGLTAAQQSAAMELLTSVGTEISPDELELLDPSLLDGPRSAAFSKGMLGLGVEAAIVLILPALASFLGKVAGTAGKDLAKYAGQKFADWIIGRNENEPLSASHLSVLCHELEKQLAVAGVPSEQAVQASASLASVLIAKPKLARELFNTKR